MSEQPTVVPLMPLRDDPFKDADEALYQMSITASKAGIKVWRTQYRRGSAIHVNRNQMIADTIVNSVRHKMPFTHVLFMDDDIVPQADALVRLVSHGKDIVGGLCTTRTDPPIPNARVWDVGEQVWENLFDWNEPLVGGDDKHWLAVGTGLMLISYQALQKIAEVWLQCAYERDLFHMPKKPAAAMSEARVKAFAAYPNGNWFRWLLGTNGAGENGEDISFCWAAKKYTGIDTFVDTTIQPLHRGAYGYSIPDYLVRRDEAIERAKLEGMYKERGKGLSPIIVQSDLADAHRQMLCAATGKPFAAPDTVEQPFVETRKVSVLIPSRGRPEMLTDTVASLLTSGGNIEILIRLDDDDKAALGPYLAKCQEEGDIEIITGPRHGYRNLHLYYNELAAQATGDWLMLWNDDALMETEAWDAKIHACGGGLKVLNATGNLNLFPIFTKKLYELLGHVSLQTHADSWLQVISRMNGIEQPVELSVRHLREEIDDARKAESLGTYAVTSPEFFSREFQGKLYADVRKVKDALAASSDLLKAVNQ